MVISLAVIAEERAIITAPAPKNGPSSLAPTQNALPFRPLDGSSSVGGVMDGGPAPSLPSVDIIPPDPKTQKEIFERMDKRRNFLLDDEVGEGKSGVSKYRFSGSKDGEEWTISPRRPQTVLEKRLRKGSERDDKGEARSTTRKSDTTDNPNDFNSKEKDERDPYSTEKESENNLSKLEHSTLIATLDSSDKSENAAMGSRGSSLGEKKSTSLDGVSEQQGLVPPEDAKSSTSSSSRNIGMDSLARQRIERFQQVTGGIDSGSRGLSVDNSEYSKPREMRSASVEAIFSSPNLTSKSESLNGGTLSPSYSSPASLRSEAPLGDSLSTFQSLTPNSGALLSAPVTPASRFLKESRPEPPRFRQ